MKTFKVILLVCAMLFAGMSHAAKTGDDLLPPPVLSKEPATVRFILKNVQETDSVDIDMWVSTLFYDNGGAPIPSRHLMQKVQEKGKRTCEIQLPVGISCTANFFSTGQYDIPSGRLVLVPGGQTTCTYDVKKRKFHFADTNDFAKLDEDMTRLHDKLSSFNMLTPECENIYEAEPDSFGNMPPGLFADTLMQRYRKRMEEMDRDKSISPQFKAVWHCTIAMQMFMGVNNYYYTWHRKNNPEVRLDYRQTDTLFMHFQELPPLCTNALFYSEQIQNISYYYYMDEILHGPAGTFRPTEAVEHHYEATRWAQRIVHELPLSQRQLSIIGRQLPEYYDRIVEINKREEAKLDDLRTGPDKGTICLLDRYLEGDSILPGLLAKYRGKPTVVYGTDYPSLYEGDIYSQLLAKLGTKANIVFLSGGGTYGEEDRFRQHAHQFSGDHYLLMAYQFAYLCQQYDHEKDAGEFLLLFDAEGHLMCRYKEGDSCFDEISRLLK
ncbi:MAG: hypothetical protein IJT97_06665 [Bacteroidaceae bacterium]|nr:hypothetical protein [Bacteroidaceae bacterium]